MALAAVFNAFLPVGFFAIYSALCALALNSSHLDRIYLSLPILLSLGLSFAHLQNLTWPSGLSSLWGLGLLVHVVHMGSVLFIRNWTAPATGKLMATYKIWQNPQLLPLDEDLTRPAIYDRRILRFALHRSLKIGLMWAIHLRLEPMLIPGPLGPLRLTDFAPAREMYWRRLFFAISPAVTSRETILRAFSAIQWIWSAFLMLESAHSGLAFLFVVVLRLDSPEEWSPMFGSPFQAYSIRRFWASFWHRIANPAYASYAMLLSRNVLGFKPHSLEDKALIAFCMFVVSGVVHSLVAWQGGDRCGYLRDTWFFVVNFVAAALETVAHKLLARLAARHGHSEMLKSDMSSRWMKLVGFCWVYGVFFWAVPKWQYPKTYCAVWDQYLASRLQH